MSISLFERVTMEPGQYYGTKEGYYYLTVVKCLDVLADKAYIETMEGYKKWVPRTSMFHEVACHNSVEHFKKYHALNTEFEQNKKMIEDKFK